MKKLPIGIQSIRRILTEGYAYVDKTGFIKQLFDEGAPFFFMSRPRRFGKSLFVNTLEEIFKGSKELFKGLKIYESDYDWQEYPVLHFDFAQVASRTTQTLEHSLKEAIQDESMRYGVTVTGETSLSQLKRLVIALSKKNRVVVLVDEYDSAIINNLKNPEIAEENRDVLKDFFATLKSLDRYLKFTFITGISKFSQVSLFSGPNNLTDITMDPKYAGMMGYTREEIEKVFPAHVHAIVDEKTSQGIPIADQEVYDEIKLWYNGYRFSEASTLVYNPFSTLNFLKNKKPKTYWYSSGTPSFLIDELKKHPKSMISLDGSSANEEELRDISRVDEIDLTALMYQTGYFTIKDYNPISGRYALGIPNEEVRRAFINSLVQNFSTIKKIESSERFVRALESLQPEELFKHIELGFSGFAYQVFAGAKECTYQGMLLSMLYGMGFDPLSERSTNVGRIDVVLDLANITYIMELKLDGSVETALQQIHDREYYKPYLYKDKQIVIIGANFSSKGRNISEWKGELLSESGENIKDIFPNK